MKNKKTVVVGDVGSDHEVLVPHTRRPIDVKALPGKIKEQGADHAVEIWTEDNRTKLGWLLSTDAQSTAEEPFDLDQFGQNRNQTWFEPASEDIEVKSVRDAEEVDYEG